MAAPTLADFFGAGATVDATDPANPKLTIAFADFAAQGLGNVAKAADPEAWATGIVKRIRTYTVAAGTDEASNVISDAPFKGTTTRNALPKVEYQYAIRIYVPDTTADEPDPDNV